MTVAAVVLAASPESALADAAGLPAVRRIADVAWSGGAVPIVVVAQDPDGTVARALLGTSATVVAPGAGGSGLAPLHRGHDASVATIRETDAILVWPARFCWVGPETVTSLIEASGVRDAGMLRPAYDGEPGWPVLVPSAHLGQLRDDASGAGVEDALGAALADLPVELLELGDPGVTHDRSHAQAELPDYRGPDGPPAGHVHEWGAAVAESDDDGPLEGPALAPYGQAVASDPDQPG